MAEAAPDAPDARTLYLLAHGHEDAGRADEAQAAWRALVCHNRFPVSPPGAAAPKPQDDTAEHWRQYRERFHDPRVLAKPSAETQYVEIYPESCEPATTVDAAMLPKYLAEAWWHIGNWELEGRDLASGVVAGEPESVWGLARAASAYRRAASFPQSAVYPFALYKYATTLRRQQRHAAAVRAYAQLLDAPGEGSVAFREAALSGLAIALTHPDFEGPRADAPYIARADVLDVESPAKAEKAMRVAIARVQDGSIVPQDRTWTPALYTRLGDTFSRLAFHDAAGEAFALVLAKFPLAKQPAAARLGIAEADWAPLVALRPGTPAYRARSARALHSTLALAELGGDAKASAEARLRAMMDFELRAAAEAKRAAGLSKEKRTREEQWADASAAYLGAVQCIQALLRVAPNASDASALRKAGDDAQSEHERIRGLAKGRVERAP